MKTIDINTMWFCVDGVEYESYTVYFIQAESRAAAWSKLGEKCGYSDMRRLIDQAGASGEFPKDVLYNGDRWLEVLPLAEVMERGEY